MAALSQVIELVFEGIDNASNVAESVTRSLSGMADTGKQLTQPFADATASILKFEAGLLATGAAIAGFSIRAADDFDIAFREIATLTDRSAESLAGFRQEILDYAAGSTQGLESITSAIYNAISAGVDYKNSVDFIREAERLSVAGKADLNAVTNALIGTLNAYGASTQDAAKYSDVLFSTVQSGKTTITELSGSLSRVTSTAALAGVPVADLGAAIATVTAAGAKTEEAITRINAVLNAFVNPSSQATKLAADLGLQFNASALKSKGLEGVLQDVARATGGSAEKMAVLFGSTEALNAANVLAITNSAKFAENLDKVRNSTGATQAAFDKMKDATDTLAQAFQVALISIGTPLLDEFNGIEDALAKLANAFRTEIDSGTFAPLLDVVELNMGKIGELIGKIAENLPEALAKVDFGPFGKELQNLFDAISRIFKFEQLSTTEGLTAAIQVIVNLLTQATAYSRGAIEALVPFAQKLFEIVQILSSIDSSKLAWLGEIGGLATAANIGFTGLLSALGNFAQIISAWPQLLPIIQAIKAELLALQAAIAAGGTGGLIAALGAAGLAGAIGLVTFELTRLSGLDKTLNDVLVPDTLAGYEGASLGTLIADIAEKLGLMGPAADEAVASIQKLPPAFEAETKAAADTRTEINAWLDAQETAAKTAADTTAEIDRLTAYYRNLGFAYDATTGALTKLNAESQKGKDVFALADNIKIEEYRTNIEGAIAANQALVVSYEQIGGGTVKATGAFKAPTDAAKEQADKVAEATKKTQEWMLEMEKLASNERIKLIEANVQLNVAQIEADVERVKSAFASIDNTISNTGDLLGNLFGTLVGTEDRFKESKIESQIDLENKRRQEALDIQRKLAEAEIERIEAQTAALERGEAVIKIDGTGLAPQLEAFMWEVLKAIRVRANAEFADYLLGIA